VKHFSLTNRCLVFTFLVINFFSCAFAREYILEVVQDKAGFKITTNIPKVGEKQVAVSKNTDSIPVATFNASTQDFLLSEDGRSIEIALDKLGHITVKKLNIADDLRITNRIAKGDIIFAGSPQQKAGGLKLYGCGFANDTELSVNSFDAIFSGWFKNSKLLIINANEVNNKKQSQLACANFHNAGQLVIHHVLTCTGRSFFFNKSNASISGQGSLHVVTNRFLNEAAASIALDGKLEVQPFPKKTSNEPTKQCSWQCVLENFAQQTNQNPESAGWPTGFLGVGQDACFKLKDSSPIHFHHEPLCNEILLLGTIAVGDCNLSAETITLQASIRVNNDCTIKPLYVLRNSGTLYVKNALDIQGGDFFYNDVNGVVSVGQSMKLNVAKIIANVSGVFSAHDITINTDRLINVRGGMSASKSGDVNKDDFVYKEFETYPLGYILAREGSLAINVNEFYQDGSFLRASNDTCLTIKNKFINNAREMQKFSTHVERVMGKKEAKGVEGSKHDQAEATEEIRHKRVEADEDQRHKQAEADEERKHKNAEAEEHRRHKQAEEAEKHKHEQPEAEEDERHKAVEAEEHRRHEQAEAKEEQRHEAAKKAKGNKKAEHHNHEQIKDKEDKEHERNKKAEHHRHEQEKAKIKQGKKTEHQRHKNAKDEEDRKHDQAKKEEHRRHENAKAEEERRHKRIKDEEHQKHEHAQDVEHDRHKQVKKRNYDREVYGDKQNNEYESSTISAGGKVVITLKDTKVELNAPQTHYTIKDFHNTGTIQGQQILELTSDEKAKLVNGFTHKKQPAVFGALPAVIDLEDGMLAKEYEIQKNNDCYYKIHPLFNENKSLNLLQEVVINASAVKKETAFLMSPLLEAMGLEFALHKHIGKIKLDLFKDHYDQCKMLQTQGWAYALVHGKCIPVTGVNPSEASTKIALSDQQKKDFQKLLKLFGGTITLEELAKRFSLLEAKTHVITLSDAQISAAPVAFIFYKVENRDGKDYMHPYLHPDKNAFEKMRRADGSLQGGEVKITGGNLQNFGFIKADKELLIKVTSFLNEKPLQERLDGIYKVIKTKPGGEYQAASATITTQSDLTFKGGTGTAAKGANTLKSEQGNVNLVNQEITNPQALDHAKKAAPSTLTAATDNNLNAKQDVKIVNSQTVAGQNTNITAGGTAKVETTATSYLAKDEVVCAGKKHSCKTKSHITEEGVAVTPATVISGDTTAINAEKTELTGATLKAGKKIELDAKKNDIKPVVVETTSTSDVKTKKLFFYDHTKSTQKQQTIIPSMLQADEIVIKSSELDTTLEAVVMYGGQLVHIVSGRNTIFKGTQVHSSMQQKGWSFGISFLGSAAIQALADGNYKGAVIALAETDPLVAAIMALSKAKDGADKFAASEYVGIEALRGLVQLSKATKLPVMTGIGQRLRVLNNEGKFRPQITFSLGFHKASADQWETVPSEINAMKLVVESGKETAFKDGTKVTAEESRITSDTVTFTPATKTQHATKKHVGFDITFGPCGFGGGVNVGKGKQHSVHYQNAVFNAAAQTWQAEDMHGQGVTLKGRVGHFDVKKIHLESVQNVEKGKETNVGVSGSQGGAFSGFFNYHKVDNAWINERSCLEFEQLHGHAAMLKLIAADIIARQKNSTFKADKTEGKTLRDHLDTFGIGIGFGYLPDDVVPVSADFDYTKQHSGGTQKAYASEHVQTGQTDNVVRDEKDKFTADKKVNRHVHFVAAWIDTKQVKQALNDYREMFKRGKVSLKEFNEKKQALEKELMVDEFFNADNEDQSSNQKSAQAGVDENSSQESQKQSADASDKQQEPVGSTKDDQQQTDKKDLKGATLVKFTRIVAGSDKENSAKIELVEQNSNDNEFDLLRDYYGGSWEAMVTDTQMREKGVYQIAFYKGNRAFKVEGSMQELSNVAERLEAFVDGREAVLLAAPTTMERFINKVEKFLNFGDRYVFPVKSVYSFVANHDYDTGIRYRDWTGRASAILNVALTVVFVKLAGFVINKWGAPALRWLANTETGKVIVDAAEAGLGKVAKKGKCVWNRVAKWLGFEGEQAAGKVAANEVGLSSEQIYQQVRSKGNLKIQPDKLGKHIEGHKNFNPKSTKSIFEHKDPQALVDKYAGTGVPKSGVPGQPGYKEAVDFGEPIGYHVDENTNIRTVTTRGMIHYAKDGVHIVPVKPV